MKIIGAGLPRTATLTQKIALEMLGLGPCYHMSTVLAEPSLAGAWVKALAGQADWDTVFDGFNATVDWPGSFFYKELLAAYPDAKVLLSVRDSRAWARSMRDTIWSVQFDKSSPVYHLVAARDVIDREAGAATEFMRAMCRQSGVFGPTPEVFDEEAVAAAMDRYNAEVRAHVPAAQLLEWSPADGWEPLCGFLGVPVPAARLPRANDSLAFKERLVAGSMETVTAWWAGQQAVAGR